MEVESEEGSCDDETDPVSQQGDRENILTNIPFLRLFIYYNLVFFLHLTLIEMDRGGGRMRLDTTL